MADNSHVISYLFFVENWENLQNLSSAAVVIGALRAKFQKAFMNILSPYLTPRFISSGFGCVCFHRLYSPMSQSVHVSTVWSVSKLTTATSVVYMTTVSGSRTRAVNTKISTPFWVRKIHSHEQDID